MRLGATMFFLQKGEQRGKLFSGTSPSAFGRRIEKIKQRQLRVQRRKSENVEKSTDDTQLQLQLQVRDSALITLPSKVQGSQKSDVTNLSDSENVVELTSFELVQMRTLDHVSIEVTKNLLYSSKQSFGFYTNQFVNLDEIYNDCKNFYQLMAANNGHHSVFLSVNEMRGLSLCFLILANAVLFGNFENLKWITSSKWPTKLEIMENLIDVATMLRSKIESLNGVTDLLYLMNFYFLIDLYYKFSSKIHYSYYEYNNLLHNLINSKEGFPFVERRSNIFALNLSSKKLAHNVLQLKVKEMATPFFRAKGLNQMEYLLSPNKEVLKIVNDKSQIFMEPFFEFQLQVCSLHFNRVPFASSAISIIHSYLTLIIEIGDLLEVALKDFSERISRPKFKYADDFLLLQKNQKVLSDQCKNITLMKLESGYFPSIIFLSHLFTVICMFNHFSGLKGAVESSDSSKTFLQLFVEQRGIHALEIFYECMVRQGIFGMCLKCIYDDHKGVIDLNYIFKLILHRFDSTFECFVHDPMHSDLYEDVPFYHMSIDLITELTHLLHSPKCNFSLPIDLTEYIRSKLPSPLLSFFVNNWFGSQDSMALYIEKVCELLTFVKTWKLPNGIPITSTKNFNMCMVVANENSLSGFRFSKSLISDYVSDIVEPNLQL
ncbi:uncharacterized protein PRCAT00003082001 [Priceomyces carsonii]|uniref:uncharacterized protein n=1 Tax=Priceomyces carsonii TaxID=28549 RepID=UPI002ED81EFA|nr:unnamed protein product [Priceomyces carsonii]